MQLYSEEKDWRKLVRVVLKLSDFVDDNKQKAKYLHTAAMVAHKEMGDVERALEILDLALAADPDMQVALEEALTLRKNKGDFDGVKQLLKAQGQGSDRGRRSHEPDRDAARARRALSAPVPPPRPGDRGARKRARSRSRQRGAPGASGRALFTRSHALSRQGGGRPRRSAALRSVSSGNLQGAAQALHHRQTPGFVLVRVPGAGRAESRRAGRSDVLQAHAQRRRGHAAGSLQRHGLVQSGHAPGHRSAA